LNGAVLTDGRSVSNVYDDAYGLFGRVLLRTVVKLPVQP